MSNKSLDDPSGVVKRRDLDEIVSKKVDKKLKEPGEQKTGSRWNFGDLSGWGQVLVPALISIIGFVTTVYVIKTDMAHLSKSVDRLSVEVSELSKTVAGIEEWKRNVGNVPTAREFDALREEVGKIRDNYKSGNDITYEISTAVDGMYRNHVIPLSNRVNRLEVKGKGGD
jgi:hypothetical protein